MPAQTLLKTSPGGPSLAGGRRHTETKFSCVVFIGQISCEIRSCCFYLAARITRQRGRTPAGQVVSGKKRKSHLKGTSRIASCKFGRGHVDREQLIDSAEAHFSILHFAASKTAPSANGSPRKVWQLARTLIRHDRNR